MVVASLTVGADDDGDSVDRSIASRAGSRMNRDRVFSRQKAQETLRFVSDFQPFRP